MRTRSAIEFVDFGSNSIIQILKASNSMPLKMSLVQTVWPLLLKNGLIQITP